MPESTWPAAVGETHAAVVFFVGERAYKLKKPVDLGFLDFSTREARQRACRREVELNRRFAPDVYLGVADVRDASGNLCDHLVVMRRMPADRRLSALVRAGVPVDDALREVARRLAAWHARAPRGPEISLEGTVAALRGRWTDSFEQVRAFHGTVIDADAAAEIERLTLRYLAGREPLFDQRIRQGRVVDGHADLLTDDIFCLDDGPRILDCLEFDDRLRHLDGLDDAAFLAMDLERLGAADAAARFTGWYLEFSGDPAPLSLLHHYIAYRAFVRVKVACLRAAQTGSGSGSGGGGGGGGGGRTDATNEIGSLTDLTLRHLHAGDVRLILVGGLPGTGKSSLSGALADRLGFTLLSSDRIRKELAGLAPEQSAAAPYASGLYDPAATGRTYAELLSRAERLLRLGESVVLDASWTSAAHRAAAARTARSTSSDLVELRCQAPREVAAERLRTRPGGASDADPSIAAAMRAAAEDWPTAHAVDTAGPLERAVADALRVAGPDGVEQSTHDRSSVPSA